HAGRHALALTYDLLEGVAALNQEKSLALRQAAPEAFPLGKLGASDHDGRQRNLGGGLWAAG
ncbi:MAG TPA: hypothetical protein PLK67_14405, partial [Bryobacteraceae bacterium]|nr:hypothetical protein [Bryobacteraceae bacterium]